MAALAVGRGQLSDADLVEPRLHAGREARDPRRRGDLPDQRRLLVLLPGVRQALCQGGKQLAFSKSVWGVY